MVVSASRRRGNLADVKPARCQQTAIILLLVANAAACIVIFHCLRLLGEIENAVASILPPEVDLALYEPPPNLELTAVMAESLYAPAGSDHSAVGAWNKASPPVDRHARSPATAATFAGPDAVQTAGIAYQMSGSQPRIPNVATQVQAQAAVSAEHMPTESGAGTSAADVRGEDGAPAGVGIPAHASTRDSFVPDLDFLDHPTTLRRGVSSDAWCAPCAGKVRGPLPTTLQEELQGPRTDCSWTTVSGKFMSNYAAGIEAKLPLHQAKLLCLELNDLCRGVTCMARQCDVRQGPNLMDSATNEQTYVKICPPAKDCPNKPRGSGRAGEFQQAPQALAASASDTLKDAAVVVLAHNRHIDLQTCLDSMLRLPDVGLFEIIVSLDDPSAVEEMSRVAANVSKAYGKVIQVWRVDPIVIDPSKHNQEQIAWFSMNAGKIAHHYWTAFEKAFTQRGFDQVIFVEEDLVFAPDFFALFRSTAALLDQDPTLWCVSAWNDIGFEQSAFDQCRLLRTSYFPGLGFLLRRDAWMQLREKWPTSPTMGWDYWMRVAFRTAGKECVIPEVSRSHHVSVRGSSISNTKQLKLLSAMALASIRSSCGASGPCNQFGDISYLLEPNYERYITAAIDSGTHVTMGVNNPAPSMSPYKLYVVPYITKDFQQLSELCGIHPKGTKNAIPGDVRAEHYGIVSTWHLSTRATLLFVDKMSRRDYLPARERMAKRPDLVAMAGHQGLSCDEVCASQNNMVCDVTQMPFINDCQTMAEHFRCEAGCAHQVGKELPVYVVDDFQPTRQQCLVTFISALSCHTNHPSTARLCACVPGSMSFSR